MITKRFKIWLGTKISRLFKFEKNFCDEDDQKCLFVRFTNACPNRCKFCFDRGCRILETEMSGKELAEAIVEKHPSRTHLMVSGGEPLLDVKRLHEFIMSLPAEYQIESLMTSLPKTAFESKELFFELLERCKVLDISTHGNSNEDDEAVYGSKLEYDKQAFMSELAKRFPDKVYASCVLTASRFSSLHEIKQRISHYTKLGIKNFYLNEVGNSEIFKEATDYISIDELFSRSHEDFPFGSAFSYGCKIDLSEIFHQWFSKDVIVKCRRRCYRCGHGNNLTWKDVLKQYIQTSCMPQRTATPVMHGDGKTTAWFTNYEI